MKKKVLFLVGLIGILALVLFVTWVIVGRQPKFGRLRVESQPDSSVFLDAKHLGRTSYEDKVAVGEYTIKVVPDASATQYASWESRIQMGHNTLTYVNASLAPSELSTAVDVLWLEKISGKAAELTVTTNPDGATILVDDTSKGVTPVTIVDVSAGAHTVTINSPGFLSRTLKVELTSGFKLVANVKLALSPHGAGVETEATGASNIETPDKKVPTGKPTPTKSGPTPTKVASAPDPDKPYALIEDTPTGFLRVREEASTGAKELAQVKPGEKYTIVDEQTGWYQIKYEGESLGWISAQYARKVE